MCIRDRVFIERVELPALGYVCRASLVQLVERTPTLGRIAEVGHSHEVDPRLLASSLMGHELGVVELVQVELEPQPDHTHECASQRLSLIHISEPKRPY